MKVAMKVAMKMSHRSISVIKRSRHWRDNCISSYKCSEGRLKNKLGNFIEMLGAVRKPHHRCQFKKNWRVLVWDGGVVWIADYADYADYADFGVFCALNGFSMELGFNVLSTIRHRLVRFVTLPAKKEEFSRSSYKCSEGALTFTEASRRFLPA